MAYNLSEKAIGEKYEDLLFTKVMALYAEEESAKILEAAEAEAYSDPKNVEKIYSKIHRKENLAALWKYSKKLVTLAAMVVFVAVISLSSVVVASAEAREAVAEAIYHLVLRKTDRYTEVSIGENTGFVDPEIYTWENAYGMTYVPDDFVLGSFGDLGTSQYINYSFGEKVLSFIQSVDTSSYVDTENSDSTEIIEINKSEAFLVTKDDWSCISWNVDNVLLQLSGNVTKNEIIKVAQSIKPIEKYEAPAEEEYTFVDPEIYTWENAFALTYIPKKYALDEIYDLDLLKIVNYVSGEKYFSFSQLREETIYADTENADKIKDIMIGNSKGLLITKDVISSVYWSVENTLLSVTGNIDENEIIKIAEGVRPIN